ncbi:MAG: hypothetical protein ACXWC4_05470 [Telluria sp.]
MIGGGLEEIRMLAMFIERFPRLFEEVNKRPGFEEIERRIVAAIANAETVRIGLDTFEGMQSLIPDWKFVFASENGPLPGLAISQTFSDGSAVRGLFTTDRVLVLDKDTLRDMREQHDALFLYDYSIALDTQALSYLAPFLKGGSTRLPPDFHEVFEFIARDEVNVDPLPYMVENLPNIPTSELEVRRRLEAYEVLRTIDAGWLGANGEVRSKLSQAERKSNVDDLLSEMFDVSSKPEELDAMLKDYRLSYCVLLKAASIQLLTPAKAAYQDKIGQLVEFMDKDLGAMFAREVLIAAHLFEHGQHEFGFFSKIQKGKPDNLKNLRGMAWDFAHVRHVEGVTTRADWKNQYDRNIARYFFSAILTCDKRYVEVLDLYPLKSYAFKAGTNRPLPFPAVEWFAKIAGDDAAQASFKRRYYSNEAVRQRGERKLSGARALKDLVATLEEEFRIAALSK